MSFEHLTIGLVGGGNMARALLRGLLQAGHPAHGLEVADPDVSQLAQVQGLNAKIRIGSDNQALAERANVLVLAVKPQLMDAVATHLGQGPRRRGQLVLSVAAGITLDALAGWFGADTPRVRVMPNQPATIGAGISGLVAPVGLGSNERQLAQHIAAAMGGVIWLESETLMDAVTALSGSGPAYFYLLMEHLERAGIELGLSPEVAAAFTRATALGAARLVLETPAEPATLRAAVTSPLGTTAAALSVFAAGNLENLVAAALKAARNRSRELGNPGK